MSDEVGRQGSFDSDNSPDDRMTSLEEYTARSREPREGTERDMERLAEQCCDEYHGEIGTFQDFAHNRDRTRWRDLARCLWACGARPARESATGLETAAHDAPCASDPFSGFDVGDGDSGSPGNRALGPLHERVAELETGLREACDYIDDLHLPGPGLRAESMRLRALAGRSLGESGQPHEQDEHDEHSLATGET